MPTWRGTTDSNWGTASNWLTDGSGSGVPTGNTDATFDASSPACTITAGANCRSLICTGYANVITFTNTLTVNMTAAGGDITFSAAVGFSLAGPNGITYSNTTATVTTRTLTTNAYNYNLPFTVTGVSVGSTLNLVGNFQVTNYTGNVGSFNFTGSELRVSGNWSGSAQGAALKVLNGAGTMATGSNAQALVINAPTFTRTFTGAITVVSTLKWTAGTVTATGSTFSLSNMTSVDFGGQTLNNALFGNSIAQTLVIPTDLYLTGNLQLANGGTACNGPGKIFVAGNLTNAGTGGGSCIIEMNGTGSITGTYGNHIIVNTSGIISTGTTCSVSTFTLTTGTLNLANGLSLNGGTLTIAIAFNFTGSSNLTITANTASITSNGVSWPTSIIMANTVNLAATITLNDPLTVTGSFTSSSAQGNAVTLNGSTLSINGNLTVTKSFAGTTNIFIIGAGTSIWSGNANATVGNNLTIDKTAGNVTLSGTVGFTNSKTLTYTTVSGTFLTVGSTLLLFTCSVRSNGANWGNINGSSNIGNSVITLLDNMACNSITGFGSFFATFNGFNLNINGDFSISSFGFAGTTIFNIIGTGNQAWPGGIISNPMKINKSSGTFTLSGTCQYGRGTGTNPLFEHIDGPVVTTGSTFFINGTCQIKSNILDPDTIVFNDLGFSSNPYIVTLIDSMTINSFVPSSAGTGGGLINGNTLFVRGDITIPNLGSNAFFGGSAIFNISGTGTQAWNSTSTSTLRNNIVINKSSGTLNLTGTIRWGLSGNTLTYSQGLINSGTSTFISTSGTIFNLTTTGFSLYDWTPPIGTQTINTQPLVVNHNLTISGTTAFTGTIGWTCVNLLCSTPGSTITLQEAITYTTTTSVTMLGTNALKILMRSSDLTIPYVSAIWTLTNTPATQSMTYVSATAINSSAGMTIWSFGGIIDSSTQNWGLGSAQGTKSFTFVC